VADPFGHGICLIEFVGKGYDEIATGNDAKPAPKPAKPAR
jgi:hypothetical protein